MSRRKIPVLEKPTTLTDLQAMLGDFAQHFEFFMKGPSLAAVKPKGYLGTEIYGKAADILVWTLKGKWISAGRQSHFEVPLAEERKELAEGQKTTGFQMLPIDALLSMPFQSRLEFDERELDELVGSIKAHGVLEPLLARPKPDGLYELVAGERRLQASRKAGLTQVPVLVRELSDQEAFEVHLTENDQRRDLSDYERGRLYSEMLRRFSEAYPSQEALADKIGKSRAYVTYHIQHYEFVEKMKVETPAGLVTHVTRLPEGITREIRQAPPEVQGRIAEVVAEGVEGERLTTRETRQLVAMVNAEAAGKKELTKEDLDLILTKPLFSQEAPARPPTEERPVKPIDFEAQGKFCPVCGRMISKELYEELKAKFSAFVGLFK